MPKKYDRSFSLQITHAMYNNLRRLAGSDRKVAELVRTAIRTYLDSQGDLIGSRQYFTGQFRLRVEALERLVRWHLTLLTVLIAEIGSILILNLLDIDDDHRASFTGSALLRIAEERTIDNGWRVQGRIEASLQEAELVAARQRESQK
jgi:hypothetical protein